MVDPDEVRRLLQRRYFVEAAYFGVVWAWQSRAPQAHMLAGVACCGCAHPLAVAQRMLEGVPVSDDDLGTGGLHVRPVSSLPYEGFFHLLEAIRLEHSLVAPADLRDVFDDVAEDLTFVSRRELEPAAAARRRYSLRDACLCGAVLLRRLTGSDRPLPALAESQIEYAIGVIELESGRAGGDAAFFQTLASA